MSYEGKITVICKHFSWKEALWLPKWGIFAVPTPEQEENIRDLAMRVELVRGLLGCPLTVTSWLRPVVDGRGDYNELIGGAKNSAHKLGKAVDLLPAGMTVDAAMAKIKHDLKSLGLRAENNGESVGRKWLHLDTMPVSPGGNRVFNP